MKNLLILIPFLLIGCSPSEEQKKEEQKRIEVAILKAQSMADSLQEIEYQMALSDTICSCHIDSTYFIYDGDTTILNSNF